MIFDKQRAKYFSERATGSDAQLLQETVRGFLRSLINQVEAWAEDSEQASSPSVRTDSRKVFIVHGHDEAVKLAVAGLLRQLELEPIVLSEQADQGRTIIKKFEEHSEVGFAVVLLTPDDTGASRHDEEPQPRARQNVIFEFGYFLGKLGRRHVRAVVKGDVEIPSDYSGVLHIPFDDKDKDGWKLKLAQELKAAGLDFDMNRLSSSG